MGNIFKKKLNRLMGKNGQRSAGWQAGQVAYGSNEGEKKARTKELEDAMKEYNDVPTTIRKSYTEAAQRAGTYANTPEFGAGLDSEVVAGSRGARVGIAGRINALKKALGHIDEFKPEGLGETQANLTKETLADKPADPNVEAAATAGPDAEAASAPTTVNTVQNAAPKLGKVSTAAKTSAFRKYGR